MFCCDSHTSVVRDILRKVHFMGHYYRFILWHIYSLSSLHLHIYCALCTFSQSTKLWSSSDNFSAFHPLLFIFSKNSNTLSRHLKPLWPFQCMPRCYDSSPVDLRLSWLITDPYSLDVGLPLSNTTLPHHWLVSSKIDRLNCSCISDQMCPDDAMLFSPGGLPPMVAPGGTSSLVASKVAWLPPGGWWWVLVATSGSCGRWVLVGVMQIPDTGHGPHATRLHTRQPEHWFIFKPLDENLQFLTLRKMQTSHQWAFPIYKTCALHNWRHFAGWSASVHPRWS